MVCQTHVAWSASHSTSYLFAVSWPFCWFMGNVCSDRFVSRWVSFCFNFLFFPYLSKSHELQLEPIAVMQHCHTSQSNADITFLHFPTKLNYIVYRKWWISDLMWRAISWCCNVAIDRVISCYISCCDNCLWNAILHKVSSIQWAFTHTAQCSFMISECFSCE